MQENFIITNKNRNEKIPIECLPQRADFALNFVCYAEVNGEKKGLLTYDYNPVWKQWFPFYDDVNKSAIIHNFSGKTFFDIIREHEKIMPIDLQYQLQKAEERFKETFDTTFEYKSLSNDSVVYELKFSKSQNTWTLYKIFNFVITSVKEPYKMLQPKNMNFKIIKSRQIAGSDLVTNVAEIYEQIRSEIESHTIQI